MGDKQHRTVRTEGIYRKVSVRMYADDRFMKLTPLVASGQALWMYLLTGPHTGPIPGVFVAGKAAMAEALGWDSQDFEKAFSEVVAQELVDFDAKTRLWFIPKAIKHNMPASPNVVKSWRDQWLLLPECKARDGIAEQLFRWLSGLDVTFVEAFEKVTGKPFQRPSPKPSQIPFPNQETGGIRQETGSRRQEAADAATAGAPAPALAPPKLKSKPRVGTRTMPIRPLDVTEQTWADWLCLRNEKRAPVTQTVLEGAIAEAKKAGVTLEEFLRIWCQRGSQGLEADWLKPHERSQRPPTEKAKALADAYAIEGARALLFGPQRLGEAIDV